MDLVKELLMHIKTRINEDGFTVKDKFEIEDFDAWNIDTTLAPIILELVKRLKKNKHGAPKVDNEDVPDELKASDDEKFFDLTDDENKWWDRWEYVLDEIIWSFEQISDPSNDEQFHHGEIHLLWQALDKDKNPIGEPVEFDDTTEDENAEYWETLKGENDTHWFDKEGYRAHHERIRRGTTLFGKYYSSLWD